MILLFIGGAKNSPTEGLSFPTGGMNKVLIATPPQSYLEVKLSMKFLQSVVVRNVNKPFV